MKKYVCGVCGYVYDPMNGDDTRGIKPGTPFEELPPDWKCPICGAPKSKFLPLDEEMK
ncbi:MAG: rubredoxin [Thermoproteota archaeon]|jgi:rubredoxin|uniref:Rubredoxin n=1 Tax=Candidatus Methanodesulfokora washburnensis TaxID=2478471 RepID=A0A3R9PL06_9CREN|nr:rubredoxin [Candidatus Methanodesulfokores washburnensis]RSN76907.1 rubredoxin [Candidatus Methanodesulfokores washburnensis]RZN62654.1 MAG: rubredoxin [Candidatus Methanodesulfokores washburnensis]TDA40846.1 MAG: rubredoxin [Candidatus Korarchaeota archaeon]